MIWPQPWPRDRQARHAIADIGQAATDAASEFRTHPALNRLHRKSGRWNFSSLFIFSVADDGSGTVSAESDRHSSTIAASGGALKCYRNATETNYPDAFFVRSKEFMMGMRERC
jgi:hypothetical protein